MLNPSHRFLADLLLLSVAIAWGATFVVVKESIENTPVFSFLFLRFGLAALVLLPFALRSPQFRNPALWRTAALLGTLYFAAFTTQTFGLLTIGASMSAFLTGLYVLIVPFLLWAFFHRPPRRRVFAASLIAVAGLWLLTSPGDSGAGTALEAGELLTLACAVLFALHIIATDWATHRFDPFPLVTLQLATVTLLSFLASLFLEPSTWPRSFDGGLVESLLITGILATAYALLVQTWMQRYTTPTRTAIIFAMEPVSAALFGYWVAGELLTALQLAGGALIVGAMILAEL